MELAIIFRVYGAAVCQISWALVNFKVSMVCPIYSKSAYTIQLLDCAWLYIYTYQVPYRSWYFDHQLVGPEL